MSVDREMVWTGSSRERRVAILAHAERPDTAPVARVLARAGWELLIVHGPENEEAVRSLYFDCIEWGVKVLPVGVDAGGMLPLEDPAVGDAVRRSRLLVFMVGPASRGEAYLGLARHLLPVWQRAQTGVTVGVLSSDFTKSRGRIEDDLADAEVWSISSSLARKYHDWTLRWACVVPAREAGAEAHQATADVVVEVTEGRLTVPSGGVVICGRAARSPVIGLLGPQVPLAVEDRRPPAAPAAPAPVLPAPGATTSVASTEPVVISVAIAESPDESLLRAAFEDCFGRHPISLESAEIGSYPGWDSLGHITLIMHLQARLSVEFSTTEMPMLDSYSRILQTIRTKRAGQP